MACPAGEEPTRVVLPDILCFLQTLAVALPPAKLLIGFNLHQVNERLDPSG
jgi:hypothetical protein